MNDEIMVNRIDRLDQLIETANETIEKARRAGAVWLIHAAEKELNFARYEKEKYLKRMMESERF